MENFSPAISVIVPVYNAEKYLPACLESILAQTFTDFELLVVDDCSTDSSLTVAESFRARDGRLKIISLPENTGNPSIPRNVGLENSRGKYVYFVDQDDFIVDDALEMLYDFAEKYRAEVIFMEKFFVCDEKPVPEVLTPVDWHPEISDDVPVFENDNLSVRVEKFLRQRFFCSPWAKFFRRDFLIDNSITLPPMKVADDIIWTFEILCLAKNFLRIPTPLYIYRANEASILRRNRKTEEKLIFWMNPLIGGFEILENFMNQIEFFVRNPRLRLRVLHFFGTTHFNLMEDYFKELSSPEVWQIFMREFTKAGSSQPALISYLIFIANIYRNELKKRTE